jgi:hypothetical protein
MRSSKLAIPSPATRCCSSRTVSYFAANSLFRSMLASEVSGKPSLAEVAGITSTFCLRKCRTAIRLCPSIATNSPSSPARTNGVGGNSSVFPLRMQSKINCTVPGFKKSCDGRILLEFTNIGVVYQINLHYWPAPSKKDSNRPTDTNFALYKKASISGTLLYL